MRQNEESQRGRRGGEVDTPHERRERFRGRRNAPVLRDKNTDSDNLCDDERLYFANDANMNVTALVGTDGTVLERYVYDPYGKVTIYDDDWSETRNTSSYDNNILFAGYYHDWETGLYSVRNRTYHPHLGLWMQRDPLGQVVFTAGRRDAQRMLLSKTWPLVAYTDEMNLYEYGNSSPQCFIDPGGEEPVTVGLVTAAIGSFVGWAVNWVHEFFLKAELIADCNQKLEFAQNQLMQEYARGECLDPRAIAILQEHIKYLKQRILELSKDIASEAPTSMQGGVPTPATSPADAAVELGTKLLE